MIYWNNCRDRTTWPKAALLQHGMGLNNYSMLINSWQRGNVFTTINKFSPCLAWWVTVLVQINYLVTWADSCFVCWHSTNSVRIVLHCCIVLYGMMYHVMYCTVCTCILYCTEWHTCRSWSWDKITTVSSKRDELSRISPNDSPSSITSLWYTVNHQTSQTLHRALCKQLFHNSNMQTF